MHTTLLLNHETARVGVCQHGCRGCCCVRTRSVTTVDHELCAFLFPDRSSHSAALAEPNAFSYFLLLLKWHTSPWAAAMRSASTWIGIYTDTHACGFVSAHVDSLRYSYEFTTAATVCVIRSASGGNLTHTRTHTQSIFTAKENGRFTKYFYNNNNTNTCAFVCHFGE